jgi:hypothetical protein
MCVLGYAPSGSINAGNFLSSSGRFNFSGRTLLHGVKVKQKMYHKSRSLVICKYNRLNQALEHLQETGCFTLTTKTVHSE